MMKIKEYPFRGAGIFFLFPVFLLLSSTLSGQYSFRENTIGGSLFIDTMKTDTNQVKIHSPKKAAIFSACVPGLGQAYNRKWWKIPIIYAGFGGLAYGFAWNQKYYRDYHLALKYRYDGDPATVDPYPDQSDDDLVTQKNYYRKYRDMCVIGAAALYTVNIIDATVDAHLWNFRKNISDDLSLDYSPILLPGSTSSFVGLHVVMSF